MKSIKWSSDLSVGIDQIDEDHRRLVQCLDDLFTACFAGQGPEVLNGILARLLQYTREHFSREEDIMRRVGYPEFETHRALHAELVSELDDFIESNALADNHGTSNKLLQFLQDWLTRHILVEDKKICRHVGAID
ncbi:MAG: hemerythrin family protein [Alphaproteobacteria bacterium]|nr:hemerythrin family protein [Alphaproteobacteria bacterium]